MDLPSEDEEPDASGLPSEGWVEIGETEALGFLGVQWEMDEADFGHMGQGREGGSIRFAKTSRRRMPLQLILGLDPDDAGQAILWQALRFVDAYPFRLILPEGAGVRSWWGLVTAISEVFDAANNVMRLQVDIQPCSDVER